MSIEFLILLLSAYPVTKYLSAGFNWYIAFLRHFKEYYDYSKVEGYIMPLLSLWIVVLWPIWIILELMKEDTYPTGYR